MSTPPPTTALADHPILVQARLAAAWTMTLPARANRITNLVVAALFMPFTVFNVSGGFYFWYYGLGVVLELVLLALIVRWAWAWPRTAAVAPGADRTALGAAGR